MPLAVEVYNICKELNKSFIRYKNTAIYLCDVARSTDKYYEISSDSTPEVIIRLYKYIEKFKDVVEKHRKKNIMKRLWYLSRNDEKMDAVSNKNIKIYYKI